MAQNEAVFLKKIRRVGKLLNALSVVSPTWTGKVALRIFCTPRRLPVREQDQAFLATAHEHATLSLDKVPCRLYVWKPQHVEHQEQNRTVLFLHGWESNAARWQKFVPPLCDLGFTVLALDAPASGHSDGKQLNLLIYSRVLRDFTKKWGVPDALVGHSLGGSAVAMGMAAFDVPHVRKAVLMAPFADSSRVIRDFGKLMGLKPAVLSALDREIERRSGIPVSEYSVAKKAALLERVEGLVLHDRDDDVAPVSEGRAIAGSWGARFQETEGLGHRMQSQSVVQSVVGFLAG